MVNRTIISLAMLTVQFETKQQCYIDLFLPLLAELFFKKRYNCIDAEIEQIVNDFNDMFGLVIPRNAFETLIRRAVTKKILEKKNKVKYINYNNLENYYKLTSKENVAGEFNEVINKIQRYAMMHYNVDIDHIAVEEALLSFLHNYDIDLLQKTINVDSILPEPNPNRNKKYEYIIISFILKESDKNSRYFNSILKIAMGHILASTILYDKYDNIKAKMKNNSVYLDTPLLISLLGFDNEFRKNATEEFLNILKNEKVKLYIFDITYQELDNVINSSYELLRNSYNSAKISKITKHCIINKIKAEDLLLLSQKLKDKINDYGISIDNKTSYDKNELYTIDEKKLADTIKNVYKKRSFNKNEEVKESTLETDVKAISYIYMLRKGTVPTNIRESKYILVSSNSSLAYACKLFGQKEANQNNIIPACVTDIFIGTLIWLQSPQKTNKLNKMKLIADCYSALQPSESFNEKLIEEIKRRQENKSIDDEDALILRSEQAKKMIMEKTFGDIEALYGENIEQIFENVTNGIKNKIRIELIAEKEAHQKTREELEKKIKKENERARILAKIIVALFMIFILFILIISTFSDIIKDVYHITKFINLANIIVTFLSLCGLFKIKAIYNKIYEMIRKKTE